MNSAQAVMVSDSIETQWLSLLACPVCHLPGELRRVAESLECDQCGAHFPLVVSGGVEIPWVLPDPASALLEWQARFKGFLHLNSLEQARLRRALADKGLGRQIRRRIEKLLSAREVHRSQVTELLEPLKFDQLRSVDATDPVDRLGTKLPKQHGLASYQSNVFRDWSWNNGENESQLKALETVMKADSRERMGNTLTLGAGACRLAYDVHRNHYVDLSVAMDINPALLLLANRVIHGETVPLYEFPVAPLNGDDFAVLRDCHAPQSLEAFGHDAFYCLFGDAMNPPFAAASFDTVLTPWLLDVIPQNLREFVPRLNQLLAPGGVWLNTGSLAFFHDDERWRYSEDELLQLVRDNGFEILSVARNTIPYLQSPASAHGRTETVLSFSARKVCNVPAPPRFEYLPSWLRQSTEAIPQSNELALESSDHLLQAQVFAAIDGQRTVADIGRLLAEQYGLDNSEAVSAVKHILVAAYERLMQEATPE